MAAALIGYLGLGGIADRAHADGTLAACPSSTLTRRNARRSHSGAAALSTRMPREAELVPAGLAGQRTGENGPPPLQRPLGGLPRFGSQEPINIISAYRSPATNAMLRHRSKAVSEHSQHMLGKAMDIRMPDVDTGPSASRRHADAVWRRRVLSFVSLRSRRYG